MKEQVKSDKDNNTGLITPDNLPGDILKELTHLHIQRLGYFLFEQLVRQRDYTRKEVG